LVQSSAVPIDHATERIDQELVVERFAEVRDRSSFFGALARGDIVMSGDEDDRDDDPVGGQLRLKLEAAHPAIQMDVQYEAGSSRERRRGQKILRRCEGFGGETGKLNQPPKRSADRVVIVNDAN
jgi:hypothetical protein